MRLRLTRAQAIRILAFLLWLIGVIVWPYLLQTAMYSPLSSEVWSLIIPDPVFADRKPIIAIWSAIVVLIFILFGDRSPTYRQYISPYAPIWSGLVIATLAVFIVGYSAAKEIDGQIGGMVVSRTQAQTALLRIYEDNGIEVQGLAPSIAESLQKLLEKIDEYEKSRVVSGVGTVSMERRQQVLESASSELPFLRYSIQSLNSAMQSAASSLQLAVRYEGQAKGATGNEAELTPIGRMVEQARTVLLQRVDSSQAMLAATEDIHNEIEELRKDSNRSFAGLSTRLGTQILVPLYDVSETSDLVRKTISELNKRSYSTFIWVTTFYSTVVLLPWVILLLFLLRKRQNRAAQIHLDLMRLDPNGRLLARAMPHEPANLRSQLRNVEEYRATEWQVPANLGSQARNGEEDRSPEQIQESLSRQAFSIREYLLNLIVLTIFVSLGWYYVFYPQGTLGIAALIQGGAGLKEISSHLATGMQPLTLGFIGAYFFVAQVLLRRYLADDLYPSVFFQAIIRFLVVFILSLVISIVSPRVPAESLSLLAFLAGIFPREGLSFLTKVGNGLLKDIPAGQHTKQVFVEDFDAGALTTLDGVDVWVEARLLEENIESVAAMARVSMEQLILGTNFSTAQIVAWVDQAILYLHAGKKGYWLPHLRGAGVVTASDLLQKGGLDLSHPEHLLEPQLHPFPSKDRIEQLSKAIVAAAPPTDTLEEAKIQSLVHEICTAVWPEQNLQYILNFRAQVAQEINLPKDRQEHAMKMGWIAQ